MPIRRDLTGQRFGRWQILEHAGPGNWHCICDCGRAKQVRGSILTSGAYKSCGCLSGEGRRIHGMSKSREYKIWGRTRDRCSIPKATAFKNYGGRGITVCERWRNNFEAFLGDVGLCPSPEHSIDRIDVNGNYAPGNVRWSTDLEQMQNTRRSKKVVDLAQDIHAARLLLGWNRETLAEKSGVSKSAVKNVELGDPRQSTLTKVLRALRTEGIEFLYPGDDGRGEGVRFKSA